LIAEIAIAELGLIVIAALVAPVWSQDGTIPEDSHPEDTAMSAIIYFESLSKNGATKLASVPVLLVL
jgi:hypothetical protein